MCVFLGRDHINFFGPSLGKGGGAIAPSLPVDPPLVTGNIVVTYITFKSAMFYSAECGWLG